MGGGLDQAETWGEFSWLFFWSRSLDTALLMSYEALIWCAKKKAGSVMHWII
jgi:hypothetical protein